MFANRRQFLELSAATSLTAAGAGLWPMGSALAADDSVAMSDLMASGPLPDCPIGNADAPVVIVEYASMTCPHCAAFHAETYPKMKSDYLDTGKARFILREFPLDPLATAAFMLARYAGKAGDDKRNSMVDLLFAKQNDWAYVEKRIDALANIVKQAGLTQSDFDACLRDQTLYNAVNKTRDIAAEKFKVAATPTFFINGRRHGGAFMPDEMAGLIKA